ncbi:MAG: heavy metal translocating P-type ATPase [Lachnospiraceae bacterium]|nr:heavy metal translocating P-type ATPase [Lachnospiraceae bacterium]
MDRYNVKGMSCAACVARVERAVNALDGVENVEVSLLTNSMTVEGTTEPSIIIEAVKKAGYKASVDKSGKALSEDGEDASKLRRKLIVSFVFLAVLFFLEFNKNYLMSTQVATPYIMRGLLQMAVAVVIIVLNRHFFVSGIKGIKNLAPNMDTLVSLGSGIAFIYSFAILLLVITGHGNENMLYFVTSGMILTFISIGKLLEARAKDRTTDALKSLMKLAPKTALKAIPAGNGEYTCEEVDIDNVVKNDLIMIKAGNHMPVDGRVISGEGYADESSLTGESVPIPKTIGDEVYTSTTLMKGTLIVEATHVGEETSLAGIIRMVAEAGAGKAPIAKIADKVAGIFVPVVMGIALVTFLAWFFTGHDLNLSLARAIAVLVISCPCAMGLATPVAIMVGSGVGAKKGILFKDAASLENVGRAQIVVLDKTGTLTEGKIVLAEEVSDTDKDRTKANDTTADKLKPDSAEAVRILREMGLQVVMLTGDKEEPAKRIAAGAGIDRVVFGVKPGGKADEVKKLKKEGKVVMVGDGINDAVALVEADVGIAIGAGKDVAIDAADIVLMNSRVMDVATTIRLSRLTLKKIKENLFWAFIYNIIGIPLAAGVFIPAFGLELPPMFGAAAMSLSSFIVVMNALTINRFRR